MWANPWPSNTAEVAWDGNGTITITGTTMKNYSTSDLPEWYTYRAEIKKVIVTSNVVHIGEFAFYNCANLETVELPTTNNLSSIGAGAFMSCGKLTSFTLPDKLTNIRASAFWGTGLESITIPASVTNIYKTAFGNCSALQEIRCKGANPPAANADAFQSVPRTIPVYVSLQSLEAYKDAAVWSEFKVLPDPEQCPTWGYCGLQGDNLTWSLDCDEGLLIISGSGAMASYELTSPAPWNFQAKNINTIIVSEGVTTLGGYAFYNCKYASSVTLPNSLMSIGRNAFNICQKITSIVIPSSVANIGQYAFSACSGLTSIRFLGCPTINIGAFQRCEAIKTILCASEIPPVCSQSQNPFTFVDDAILGAAKLSVPGSAISEYQAHEIWGKFDIQASAQKKIQFVNEAGQVLKTEMLDEGAMPNADGLSPTKAADEDYVYEFSGWLPTIHEVKEDYIYVAHFVRTPKKFFNATVGGTNCSLVVTTKLPEGAYMNVTVNPDECFEFEQWSDGNKDNPRVVSGDMNVSAELNKIKYTVTDNSQNGQLNIAPQE